VDSDGTATATATGTALVGGTYYLTIGKDNIVAGAGNDTFVAATNTLSSGDVINGGGGTNTLLLAGGGTFNLALPATLTNIQYVSAQEGQGGTGGTAQTVTLRAGLNLTVNVAADPNSGDTAPTITIVGAANSDVINLGPGLGNDTVTLGAGETVNGNNGNDTFNVTAGSIGAPLMVAAALKIRW
jgi:hypothetical protein